MQMFWDKRKILIYILCFIFSISWFLLLDNVFWDDLMKKAFEAAMSHDTVIDMWNTKSQVWKTLLREKTVTEVNLREEKCVDPTNWSTIEAWMNNQEECEELWWKREKKLLDFHAQAPLIVRITKFLLRMTIVLSISMVIFNSVKYMIEVLWWKDRKSAESKKNLIYVVAWVILALLSVSIINLIISVPKSSLQTSDDVASFSVKCKIGTSNEILADNALKKYLCESALNGVRKYKWFWRKCNTPPNSNKRIEIDSTEAQAMCRDNLGWEVVD